MVEFRKWFPALALVTLLFGATTLASAQGFTCQTSTGQPPIVRAEGVAELLGDIVLRCSGGTPTTAGTNVNGQPITVPAVNVSVFLNTNITSRLITGNLSEALLILDDPTPENQIACLPPATLTYCPVPGAGPGGINFGTYGGPNVFQGQLVTQTGTGQQYLFWPGVPIDAPGTTTGGSRTIRITNVRGNASGVGVSTTFLPNQIIAFISFTAPGNFSISVPNPQQAIGFPIRGLGAFNVYNGLEVTTSGTLSPFLQCVSATVPESGFRVRFTEGFASAFKPRNANPGVGVSATNGSISAGLALTTPPGFNGETSTYSAANLSGYYGAPSEQDLLGASTVNNTLFTETGFYNPILANDNPSIGNAGLATNGTRLIVRFSNIPNGVTLYGGVYEASAGGDPTKSRVVLVSGADSNGAGGSTAATGTTITGASIPTGNVQAVTLANGAGYLVYEVVTSDPFTVESIDIPLFVAYSANAVSLTAANALPTVTGALAPISTTNQASLTAPVPRFIDLPYSSSTFLINPCRTNLLFPFVTNQFGFDTGIAISNTSQDPFGTTTQSGPCTINYYGSTLGGGSAPAAQRTTAPVPAGSTFTFTLGLGSGSTFGIPGATAFSGYIIATCDFQYAHGFAFITDGPIGTARVAEGYLALVMDTPTAYRTGYISESLNQ